MIREDRVLLTELARLNRDMPALAMRIMEGSASLGEQTHYSQRLIALGEQLQHRANETAGVVIEGEVLEDGPLTVSARTTGQHLEP